MLAYGIFVFYLITIETVLQLFNQHYRNKYFGKTKDDIKKMIDDNTVNQQVTVILDGIIALVIIALALITIPFTIGYLLSFVYTGIYPLPSLVVLSLEIVSLIISLVFDAKLQPKRIGETNLYTWTYFIWNRITAAYFLDIFILKLFHIV